MDFFSDCMPWMRNNNQMSPFKPMPYGVGAMTPQMPGNVQIPLPPLPTGIPGGPAPSGTAPMPPPGEAAPVTTTDIQYTQGYLKTQIGKKIRVEFLIGSSGPLLDRTGTLIGVGTSYILIRPNGTDDILMCDMYSIKFVTTII